MLLGVAALQLITLQGSRSTPLNHYWRRLCIMGACNYGTIGWVFWWTGLRSTKVRGVLLPSFINFDAALLGPVRAVAFHPSRALLVTGGDDYKIKVWGE